MNWFLKLLFQELWTWKQWHVSEYRVSSYETYIKIVGLMAAWEQNYHPFNNTGINFPLQGQKRKGQKNYLVSASRIPPWHNLKKYFTGVSIQSKKGINKIKKKLKTKSYNFNSCLLVHYAVSTVKELPIFHSRVLPPPSGTKDGCISLLQNITICKKYILPSHFTLCQQCYENPKCPKSYISIGWVEVYLRNP